jgi:hypothetical protein
MLRGTYRCGAGAWLALRRMAQAALVMAGCGLMAAGCTSSGQPGFGAGFGPAGFSAAGLGATTVAFESIDGPPETVFRKLVSQLTQEANARQVAVVSRESLAQYRIRGYVAAHVLGKKTSISWVWDIYTADHQRAMRLAGEVPGASSERAWAAADDQVVTRMARDGMERLAVFLANPGPAPIAPASPPYEPSPNVASAPGTDGTLAFLPAQRP